MSRLNYRTPFIKKNTVTKEILEFDKFCVTYVVFVQKLKLKDVDVNKLYTWFRLIF